MAQDNAPLGTDPASVSPDPAPTPDTTSSLNPVTLTIVRDVLKYGLAIIATKTGITSLNDPDTLNVSVTVVSGLFALGLTYWAAHSATVLSRINDLVKRGDIHSIHASPAIVAAAADPKVKTP